MILKEYDLSVRLPQERAIDTGITLVQNDKDVYKLNVRIFDGVNEIDYTDVTSATITFLKSDKNVVQGDMTIEADRLSYTLGTNEIACPGKVLVSIQLFGSTERLSTARFVIYVERDLVTEDAVKSASEFPILQQLKQDLEAIDVVELTNEFNAHTADYATEIIKKANKQWGSPIELALQSGWGWGENPIVVEKNDLGICVLHGRLIAGSKEIGATVMTLPTGYRPIQNCVIPLFPNLSANGVAHLSFGTSGGVWVNKTLADNPSNAFQFSFVYKTRD